MSTFIFHHAQAKHVIISLQSAHGFGLPTSDSEQRFHFFSPFFHTFLAFFNCQYIAVLCVWRVTELKLKNCISRPTHTCSEVPSLFRVCRRYVPRLERNL